jgi:FKBP-type peptidyl-prolyl cis-trans isomerase FklB
MKINQRRVIAILTALLIGFTMFSMANATSPEENKAAGEAFLTENAKKENITTTASGLQYEVITEGDGSSPTATTSVTVHYKGTTLDGKEFDSSYSRNAPATFPLNRVIAGWTEGLQLMNKGAKYRFFIPSTLAYGKRGAGADIGPNAALIFEVELLEF